MTFYDGVSRGEILRKLMEMTESVAPSSAENIGIRKGLKAALGMVQGLQAEGMWHDPDGERYPVPEGVLVMVEITQCRHQNTGRAWWDGTQWRTVGGVLQNEWVTGWQYIPKPREEKQHD